MTDTTSSMDGRVAVFGFPTHAATLLKLLRRLASAAPTTIFSFNTAKANSSIFSPQSPHGLHNLRVYDVADGVPEGPVLSANSLERIDLFLKATPGNFYDAMKVAEVEIGRMISCLVSDAFCGLLLIWLRKCGSIWTAGLYPLSVHIYTDAIREAVEVMGKRNLLSFL